MEKIDNRVLGQTIRKIRLERGYSQADVARVLHCCRSAYSYKESGNTMFNLIDLQQLAEFFEIPPETFFHTGTHEK